MSGKKHILIISGPMGSGHVRAAAGIEGWARKKYPESKYQITNMNIADIMWGIVRWFYSRVYNFLVNYWPTGWTAIYNQNDDPDQTLFWYNVRAAMRRRSVKGLLSKLKELKPDYIICTHFLPAEILNWMKKKGKINIPVASVVTDFSINRIYVQPELEYFFVASMFTTKNTMY